MVHFSTPLCAVLVLAASAAAMPTTSTTHFTFTKWIEDIIADPSGQHLTPAEAIAAAKASEAIVNPLHVKRVTCDNGRNFAPAEGAAACLDQLTRLGFQGVQCGVPAGTGTSVSMCRIGGADVSAHKGTDRSNRSASCSEVAQTGGRIFDSCYRGDFHTVRGTEFVPSQGQLLTVSIQGV